MSGTGFSDNNINNGGTIDHYLTNPNDHWILSRGTVANIPTGAGYAVGGTYQATDTGNNYVNKGSTTAASFVLLDAGTAFGLPTAASDSATTTGDSALFTETTLTTGNGLRILATTGTFTTGGALFKADLSAAVAGNGFVAVTTGVYTGTGLLTLSAVSGTTGTLALFTGGGASLTSAANLLDVVMGAATAGTALRIVTTGVYVTGSNGLITLTANSATTTTGLLQMSATGLTSGSMALLTGGGANMLTGGKIIEVVMGAATVGAGMKITNTGAYTDTASAILSIVASTASTTGNVFGITTISSRAIMVGQALATPAFQVDASTASQIAGIKITGAATGGTVAIAAIDSGSNTNITLDGKGSGTIGIGTISTGAVTITPATTITGLVTMTAGFTSIANGILKSATAVPATAGAVAAGAPITMYSGNITIELTSDVPTHSRNKGSICINTGGSSTSTRLYVNNGTTNWVAITTAS